MAFSHTVLLTLDFWSVCWGARRSVALSSLFTLGNASLKSLLTCCVVFCLFCVGRPDVRSQESDKLSSSLLQGVVLDITSELPPYSLRQSSNMVTNFSSLL